MTHGLGHKTHAQGQANTSAPPRKKRANLGQTTLKRKRGRQDPMREFDGLPQELRAWVASADLPWRPGSVRRSYERALAETGDKDRALAELDRLQERLVAKDAKKIWGEVHPKVSDA